MPPSIPHCLHQYWHQSPQKHFRPSHPFNLLYSYRNRHVPD
jgi:hypothetical protein